MNVMLKLMTAKEKMLESLQLTEEFQSQTPKLTTLAHVGCTARSSNTIVPAVKNPTALSVY